MKKTWKRTFYCCSLLLLAVSGFAQGADLGVVYPQLRKPYNQIFQAIIKGIEQGSGEEIDLYMLASESDMDDLTGYVIEKRNKVILALGARGVEAVEKLTVEIPIVLGAVLPRSLETIEKNYSGIMLLPDPELLFSQLLKFAPHISEILVVYNPANNALLINAAQESANSQRLTLSRHPATDLKDATLQYQQMLEDVDPATQALWLVQDATTLNSDVVLPEILKRSWEKSLIVFSNSLVHAKRGALFSMYPNNVAMGKELATLAQKQREKEKPETSDISLLRSLKVAVNTRTAKHLGIRFNKQQLRSFDLTFPRR